VLKSNKILLGWLAFIFVAGHCLAIFIYAFPENLIPVSFKRVSSHYVSPVFEQTWSLFAPAPIHDDKLRVKYYFGKDSIDWFEPMAEIHQQHALYRCSYHGDLALGESNLLYYTGNDLVWMGLSMYEPIPEDSAAAFRNTSSYWMMQHFLYGMSDYLFEKYPDSAWAECTFTNVKTGESGQVVLPFFQWNRQ